MTKNIFIYVVIIFIVAIAGWFFYNKVMNATKNSDINSVVGETESPTPSVSPEVTANAWVKLSNGLEYQDVVVGNGDLAKKGDVVAAHYNGTLLDGTKFDSSYDRGEPFAFILGGGMVIEGWDIGVEGMRVGGKRKLRIPSELGYGERGAGNAIPPNATLLFDIELMAVQTPQN